MSRPSLNSSLEKTATNLTNLFVKNLHEAIDDGRLREEFSRCGLVTSAKVMRLENGVSRGYGFVCFRTPYEAQRAIFLMNGRILDGKPLFVGIAQKKEERRKVLEAQFRKGKTEKELQEETRQRKLALVQAMGIGFLYPKIFAKIESVMMELGEDDLGRIASSASLTKQKITEAAKVVEAIGK